MMIRICLMRMIKAVVHVHVWTICKKEEEKKRQIGGRNGKENAHTAGELWRGAVSQFIKPTPHDKKKLVCHLQFMHE